MTLVVLTRTFLSDFLLIGISAIPAGVSSSEANKLANLYIRECENRKTVEEVAALQYSMVLDFCNLCATAIIPFAFSLSIITERTNAQMPSSPKRLYI